MTEMDWEVLNLDGVQDAVIGAAKALSEQYGHTMEFEDAAQEASIIAASNPAKVRAYVENGDYGYLSRWLYHLLRDGIRTEANHRALHLSRERLLEGRSE